MITRKFLVDGMHCQGCETTIEQAVAQVPGVRNVKADFVAGTATISFDPARTNQKQIVEAIDNQGYQCSPSPIGGPSKLRAFGRLLVVLLALTVIVVILIQGDRLAEHMHLPQFERSMSYGILFLIGFVTGFHCVGMCVAFVVGYTASAATSLISAQATRGLLKASAFLVMALGLIMLNRGLIMSGSGYDFRTLATLAATRLENLTKKEDSTAPAGDYQVIRMEVNKRGFKPDTFVLKKGVPVKWIIEGKELNYCNHRIIVPSLGLEFDVVKGEQTVEFTPQQTGMIPWSCWMGMIPGSFIVQEDAAGPEQGKSDEQPGRRPPE